MRLTDTEMLKTCLRLCGPHVQVETHTIAPEICPVALLYWQEPQRKREALEKERAEQCASRG